MSDVIETSTIKATSEGLFNTIAGMSNKEIQAQRAKTLGENLSIKFIAIYQDKISAYRSLLSEMEAEVTRSFGRKTTQDLTIGIENIDGFVESQIAYKRKLRDLAEDLNDVVDTITVVLGTKFAEENNIRRVSVN